MRRLLLLLTPLLLSGGFAVLRPASARAETLEEFALQLGEINARVRLWLRLAERLPEQDTIDRYVLQRKEDFKRKGAVEAKDLLAIVVTPRRELHAVRETAAKVLKEASGNDYDPDLEGRTGGSTSKRGQFALKEVIKYVNDSKKGDAQSRQLVHEILQVWFGVGKGKSQSAILNFKADDEKTWGPAAAAWREVARDS